MKKTAFLLFCLIIFQSVGFAKDILIFQFSNEGWHKVESPDGVKSKKCYVPAGQTAQNFNEMLIFMEKKVKNEGLSAMVLLHRQLGKDRNNYRDIIPQYIVQSENNAMVAWCSKLRNTCTVERTFKGNEGVVFAIYVNKMPHYSNNMFGQWSNILGRIEVFDKNSTGINSKSLVELD